MLMASAGADFGVYAPRSLRASYYYRCVEGHFEERRATTGLL